MCFGLINEYSRVSFDVSVETEEYRWILWYGGVVTNRDMDFILEIDEEFNCQNLYVLPLTMLTGSTIINQKLVDSMSAPGAVAIEHVEKWNFPLFWSFLVTNKEHITITYI